MKFSAKGKKSPKTQPVAPNPAISAPSAPGSSGLTTQDWLPIQSILDGILTRPDGTLVAGLLIHPMNLSLMAQAEQHRVVTAFRAAIDRLTTPWQMVSTFRPVDLTNYRQQLAVQSDQLPQGMRRQVLDEYRRWILSQAQGEATERMHALVVQHRPGKGASEELRKTLYDLKQDLHNIEGFHTEDLTNGDWYRLIQLMFAGNTLDPSGPGRLAPIYASHDDRNDTDKEAL